MADEEFVFFFVSLYRCVVVWRCRCVERVGVWYWCVVLCEAKRGAKLALFSNGWLQMLDLLDGRRLDGMKLRN